MYFNNFKIIKISIKKLSSTLLCNIKYLLYIIKAYFSFIAKKIEKNL